MAPTLAPLLLHHLDDDRPPRATEAAPTTASRPANLARHVAPLPRVGNSAHGRGDSREGRRLPHCVLGPLFLGVPKPRGSRPRPGYSKHWRPTSASAPLTAPPRKASAYKDWSKAAPQLVKGSRARLEDEAFRGHRRHGDASLYRHALSSRRLSASEQMEGSHESVPLRREGFPNAT
ncbi:hypothetical protein MRX96_011425 [Rhipicephalus microplus]